MIMNTILKNKRLKILQVEHGSAVVWMAITIIVIMGMAALVIDVGFLQREHARMQRAVDAAALAGAKQLPDEYISLTEARVLADLNGYSHGIDGVTVNGIKNPDGMHSGWYQVEISKPVDFFFAPVLGYTESTIIVTATASYTTPLPLYISGSANEYGSNGIMNLSCFGPYAPFSYGDCYSTQWLNNGQDNPYYNENGYNFILEIKNDYYAKNGTNIVEVQIFDPDTWNIGNANNAGVGKVDEIRYAPGSPHPQPSNKVTTTRFQLFAPDYTPADYSDDFMIAEATWYPGDNWSDMQWITPEGWTINISEYGYGDYRINVKTLDGSSENGFNLRAGAPDFVQNPDAWFPDNGTEIMAVGNLPINFNQSGTVNVDLGYIPSEAAGFDVYVNKFDTDVGAKSVYYYDEHGNTWPGTLSGNGTFKIDVLTIPTGYPGGRIFAEYQAGVQDTSVWQLYFDGFMAGAPPELKLVD